MKNKILIVAIVIIALLVLFVPKVYYLNDGGTVEYKAILYSVTKFHQINDEAIGGYLTGTCIEILGKEVYNNLETHKSNEKNNEPNPENNNRIVISQGKIENLERLDKFLDNTSKYNSNRISDSIVIVLYTIEGDPILHTLSYLAESNEFELTIDNTQDKFAGEEDRKIMTNKYSGEEYKLVKVIEENYIRIKLKRKTQEEVIICPNDLECETQEEVAICSYDKDLEKNKDTNRTKVKDVELTVEGGSTDKLVRYNGILYGESSAVIDYIKNPDGPIGVINKLIGEEYLPTLNNETNSEELLGAVVDSANEKSMILEYNNEGVLYIAIDENTHSFFAKVIEFNEKSIMVEPLEGSKELKSSDKISIGLGENNDAIYEVGTTVKITYNGTILETYPAQIKAINIEAKSAADNFELIFNERKDLETKTIISKDETNNYTYNIYSYGGNVKIKIDDIEYDLREALLNNKITMEEIIAKANQDAKDKKIKTGEYNDGGTIEYKYDEYTIIKYHTLNGNRDVYI